MSSFGLLSLIVVLALAALPEFVNAGGSACDVSSRCPATTITAGKTSAYCTALLEYHTCLGNLLTDTDCTAELSSISGLLATNAQNFIAYDCGVAGLVASSVLCLIVCVLSMVVKG